MSATPSGMEGLIPLINELQNVFSAVGSSAISLPQLVVVGSQSSGKSSVLEHIVGRDFLPRGVGIVTRRPLILQLNYVPTDEDDEEGASPAADEGRKPTTASSSRQTQQQQQQQQQEEWGEFLHLPGKKFYNFDEIRDEIARETERICHGKSISHQPLHLAIFSPHVLTLTLVDLPGITKVAVAGQPEDIESQINSMILSYISSPHSIIVAVSAANTDIANSDSLKLAREVDPSGIRTLGVLTKIDLMDRGTDAMQVLNNNAGVELQHGFVGLVLRSQEAITQRRSIRDALLAEKNFFSSHPIYRSIASRLGTPFLAKKLNAILMMHIQSSLPDIRNKIGATILETQAELESYGVKGQENQDKSTILLPLISKYCSHLNDALEGRSPDVSTTELYGGARISYVFQQVFGQSLLAIDPLDLLSDHDIRISIRNASGCCIHQDTMVYRIAQGSNEVTQVPAVEVQLTDRLLDEAGAPIPITAISTGNERLYTVQHSNAVFDFKVTAAHKLVFRFQHTVKAKRIGEEGHVDLLYQRAPAAGAARQVYEAMHIRKKYVHNTVEKRYNDPAVCSWHPTRQAAVAAATEYAAEQLRLFKESGGEEGCGNVGQGSRQVQKDVAGGDFSTVKPAAVKEYGSSTQKTPTYQLRYYDFKQKATGKMHWRLFKVGAQQDELYYESELDAAEACAEEYIALAAADPRILRKGDLLELTPVEYLQQPAVLRAQLYSVRGGMVQVVPQVVQVGDGVVVSAAQVQAHNAELAQQQAHFNAMSDDSRIGLIGRTTLEIASSNNSKLSQYGKWLDAVGGEAADVVLLLHQPLVKHGMGLDARGVTSCTFRHIRDVFNADPAGWMRTHVLVMDIMGVVDNTDTVKANDPQWNGLVRTTLRRLKSMGVGNIVVAGAPAKKAFLARCSNVHHSKTSADTDRAEADFEGHHFVLHFVSHPRMATNKAMLYAAIKEFHCGLQGRTYNGDVPMVLGASFRYARSTVGVSGIQLAESLVASPYIGFTVQSPTQRFMLATNIITHNSTPLFIPEIAFELLTKKQIERLLQPSLDCVDLVWNELQRVALQCELLSPELIRFPHLRTRMLQVFQTLLKSCLEPTKAHIEAVIQCELSFINTSHSDFIGGSAAVAIIMDRIHRMQAKSSSERSSSSSASSAPSDLSSKVAGVTGMVSNKHRSESSVAEADGGSKPNYLHSRTDSRAVNSTASSTTVAAPSNSTSSHGGPTINTSSSVAPSPATSGRQGFFSSFFRSPPPAAVEAQRKRYSGHQSSGERLSQETDSFASLQEHEMYMSANNAPAAASSHAHALAASSAGAPAWHIRSLEPTERELIEVEVIKILMQSYFGIVRKTVMDAVPKAIMCFLVKRIQREIQAMLVRDLYQPQLLDQLLREADDIAEKREAAAELLQILERAIAILNSARDFNALC